MTAVPQATLSWLWNVLTKNHYDPKQTYRDPNRTYHDVVQALAQCPSFSPRTDVYTYENGTPSLLLHLVGTLPVSFRGNSYNIPVDVWIPSAYPLEAPIVYVTPTPDMVVRTGQHVTLEGRVYHHYLAHWHETWDRSSIERLFSVLCDVFSKEPPVKGRSQSRPMQPETPRQGPPPVPPLPPDLSVSSTPVEPPAARHQRTPSHPPKLPPKPGQTTAVHSPSPAAHTTGAPMPPLPPKPQNGINPGWTSPINAATAHMHRSGSLHTPQQMPTSPGYPRDPSQSHGPGYTPPRTQILGQDTGPRPPLSPAAVHQPHYQQQQPQPAPPHPNQQYQQAPFQPLSQPARAQRKETPDLLTSPFDVELPSITPTGPPPPVPPNPEKDALLQTLSRTLTENLQGNVSQSRSAVTSLQSQSQALDSAMIALQRELATLNSFQESIQSNINILQQSLRRADAVIADAKARTSQGAVSDPGASNSSTASGLPPVDEVLVAPTVVGKQLYDLVAEERGIQQAIYALQAALVRGVIGAETWSRHTRSLAREAFLKRALIRKIAVGMGLDVGEGMIRPEF